MTQNAYYRSWLNYLYILNNLTQKYLKTVVYFYARMLFKSRNRHNFSLYDLKTHEVWNIYF